MYLLYTEHDSDTHGENRDIMLPDAKEKPYKVFMIKQAIMF